MTDQNTKLGIWLMVAVTFVIWVAWHRAGGLRAASATSHPILQPLRGLLLAVQIWLLILGFVKLGLVGNHTVFASALGITVFGEVLELHVAIGAAVVVAAGLFTLWRARQSQAKP